MKTMAELRREATSDGLSFELVERYGKTGDDIPERLRGIRTVSRVNTKGIYLVNDCGMESELRTKYAKLFKYDGDTLKVYQAGERDLTEQEKNCIG